MRSIEVIRCLQYIVKMQIKQEYLTLSPKKTKVNLTLKKHKICITYEVYVYIIQITFTLKQ